jgi:hypothetical protein
MARHHRGPLVDQGAALRLESLGVPVRWEAEPQTGPRPGTRRLVSRTADIAGAATLGVIRKFIDPLDMPNVEQAEAYDETAENLTGGWFDRLLEHNICTVREARLMCVLDEIHRDRAAEPIRVGVVFGASHMPAVVDHMCRQLGYIAASAEWLTVVHRRS